MTLVGLAHRCDDEVGNQGIITACNGRAADRSIIILTLSFVDFVLLHVVY